MTLPLGPGLAAVLNSCNHCPHRQQLLSREGAICTCYHNAECVTPLDAEP